MLGWVKAETARASRKNLARYSFVVVERNFIATRRPSVVSSARYTTPIPPSPSWSMIRYWEIVSPIILLVSSKARQGRIVKNKRSPGESGFLRRGTSGEGILL